MMLKINSATTAKEINPLGDEPKLDGPMCCSVEAWGYEHDAWKQSEDKLREYVITHRTYFYGNKTTKFDISSMSDSGKKFYGIGTTHKFIVYPENNSCILL